MDNSLIDTSKVPKSRYYINGKNYAKEGQILEVPKDSYFVLGDNSKASRDSRDFGFLPYNNIKGKAIKIFLPLKRISDMIYRIMTSTMQGYNVWFCHHGQSRASGCRDPKQSKYFKDYACSNIIL